MLTIDREGDSLPACVECDQGGLQRPKCRGISSVGRAFGWQPKGQRFEPAILHSESRRSAKICGFFYLDFRLVRGLPRSVTVSMWTSLFNCPNSLVFLLGKFSSSRCRNECFLRVGLVENVSLLDSFENLQVGKQIHRTSFPKHLFNRYERVPICPVTETPSEISLMPIVLQVSESVSQLQIRSSMNFC